MQYFSFDMSKNSKKNLDVIGPLLKIASTTVSQIGFFHNGTNLASTKLQKGLLEQIVLIVWIEPMQLSLLSAKKH